MIGSIAAARWIAPSQAVQDEVQSGLASGAVSSGAPVGGEAEAASRVTLSAAGRAAASAGSTDDNVPDASARIDPVPPNGEAQATADNPAGPTQLTPEELKQVEALRERDRKVRAHEQAHQAAAGALGGGASFTYQRGPDGINYAIGGEVQITLQEGRTPDETIANAQTIRAAALAPADPSAQDRAVAAAAGQMEAEARAEQAQQTSLATGGSPPADGQTQGAATSAATDRPAPRIDAAVDRTRAGLADIYGLATAQRSGFAARA